MVSETVNVILNAEKKAEEKLKATRAEAEQVVAGANDEAAKLISSSRADAQQEAASLRRENEAKFKAIEEKSERLHRDSVSGTRAAASEKASAAVELVIEKLIR